MIPPSMGGFRTTVQSFSRKYRRIREYGPKFFPRCPAGIQQVLAASDIRPNSFLTNYWRHSGGFGSAFQILPKYWRNFKIMASMPPRTMRRDSGALLTKYSTAGYTPGDLQSWSLEFRRVRTFASGFWGCRERGYACSNSMASTRLL